MKILSAVGIVNDVDYNFIDPENFVSCLLSDILPKCGHDAHDAQYFVKMSKIGEPFRKTWSTLYGREGFDEFNSIYQRTEPKYRHLLRRIDGVYEALENLGDRGFKLSVLANKQNFALNNSLIVAGLEKFFPEDLRIGITDGYEPKPSGEAIWELADRMEVDVKNLVMVGDAIVDIEAGLQAEAQTVGVLTGGTTRRQFEEYGDQIVVLDSFASLPSIVKKI